LIASFGIGAERFEDLQNELFFTKSNTENLQNVVKRGVEREPFPNDCDEDVHRDGNPYLSLHRILAGSVKRLDPKVLLSI
jgi:hypothetical protein